MLIVEVMLLSISSGWAGSIGVRLQTVLMGRFPIVPNHASGALSVVAGLALWSTGSIKAGLVWLVLVLLGSHRFFLNLMSRVIVILGKNVSSLALSPTVKLETVPAGRALRGGVDALPAVL